MDSAGAVALTLFLLLPLPVFDSLDVRACVLVHRSAKRYSSESRFGRLATCHFPHPGRGFHCVSCSPTPKKKNTPRKLPLKPPSLSGKSVLGILQVATSKAQSLTVYAGDFYHRVEAVTRGKSRCMRLKGGGPNSER